jgi:hypothetical protein
VGELDGAAGAGHGTGEIYLLLRHRMR